jgi:mannose-6-phosphate isomerase-like protein (cupin superfamily)
MLFSGQVISLSPGDIVLVPSSAWYSVQQYLSITTTLVSVATLIFTVMTWAAPR